MNEKLATKLSNLPKAPGVYFFKDKRGKTIYIGKAAVLRNRVRQYFQKKSPTDVKTKVLVSEIADVDWIEVETELDALFLEAELIRRNQPKYNILLRDDKSLTYIKVTYKSNHPTVSLTRRPLDDNAEYFGPYFSTAVLRKALNFLRRIFPYSTHVNNIPKRVCLQYHLGLCPGLEENKTSLNEYRANLRSFMKYLKGERTTLMTDIEKKMNKAAKAKDYEVAAKYRNQLMSLKSLSRRIVFSDKENAEINKDEGLAGLSELLGLASVPTRIEGYDISHMQGTNNTASMVVFVNGLPDKVSYRKFKMRLPGNNDFAHMEETLMRRLSSSNITKWGLPSLFLIDGGKGQLSSAIKARNGANINLPMIGLAKREEDIVVNSEQSLVKIDPVIVEKHGAYLSGDSAFQIISLPKDSPVIKLLQRVRDESHRFAVSYHTVLKIKNQRTSLIDAIPGIGPATRKVLLKKFGSIEGIRSASHDDLVELIGPAKTKAIESSIS